MSIKERQIYHLTPRGWEAGSFYGSPGPHEEVPVPEDCLMTVECIDDLVDPLAGESEFDDRVVWESDDKDAIRQMQEKYGERPDWFGYRMST